MAIHKAILSDTASGLLWIRFSHLFIFYLQHHHYVMALIDRIHDAGPVIHQQALIIDNLY
ncbi:unnamed protein product [Musa acuminata subsp. malaccensis]|uniref:(wild Malaysian banana) hypothetical protein n=1 Tax=Musa acuminata subsp. malaccensis TaxID=214687 RepID=A0A804K9Q2_MUSAM|nr:unnamed protein product [Musa acuminata subsp. malaccensis]